jgi:hypothetical protein
VTIDVLRPDDWDAVRAICLEGIATGQATFETEAPTWGQGRRTAEAGWPPGSRQLAGRAAQPRAAPAWPRSAFAGFPPAADRASGEAARLSRSRKVGT